MDSQFLGIKRVVKKSRARSHASRNQENLVNRQAKLTKTGAASAENGVRTYPDPEYIPFFSAPLPSSPQPNVSQYLRFCIASHLQSSLSVISAGALLAIPLPSPHVTGLSARTCRFVPHATVAPKSPPASIQCGHSTTSLVPHTFPRVATAADTVSRHRSCWCPPLLLVSHYPAVPTDEYTNPWQP